MKQLLHTPEGVRDIYGNESAKKLTVEKQIRTVMNRYGYQDIQTPGLEFFDIFRKERGSVASNEMFKFFDRDGNTLVLRPDMTPSVARCAVKYFSEETVPVRLCYLGNTYINHSSYQGRLKECTDAGAECIGDGSVAADAEMVAMVIECLLKTGLTEFQIELGHSGFFDGLLDEAGIAEEERQRLRELFDNKNYFGIEACIAKLPLPAEKKEIFSRLPNLFGSAESLTLAKSLASGPATMEAIHRLEQIYEILQMYGLEKYVSFDLGMMVTYRYYTGVIFKGYTYGTGDTIISGGRYDTLMAQFGKESPAVGFKISVDGLLTALERQHVEIPADMADTMVVYDSACQALAVQVSKQLRSTGVKLALYSLEQHSLEEYIDYGRRAKMGGILFIKENGREIDVIEVKSLTRQTMDLSTFLKEG